MPDPVYPGEPTRVVRQVPVPAVVQPVVAAGVPGVDPRWLESFEDRLRSLQMVAAFLALLTVAALGVALWALTHDDDSGRQGASKGRVTALTERVNRLETKNGQGSSAGASAASTKALRDDVEALRTQVGQASGGASGGASSATVTALGTRVDKLAAQLDDLRSQAATGTTTP